MDARPARWFLRFQDTVAERGFVKAQHSQLRSNVAATAVLMVLVCGAGVLFVCLAGEDPQLSKVRNSMFATVGLLYLASGVATKCPRLLAVVGPVGLEIWVVCTLIITHVLFSLSTPAYLFKIVGATAETGALDEMTNLLRINAFVTGAHMALPVRWLLLWYVELVAVLAFLVPASIWGTMPWRDVVTNTFILVGLLLACGIGKRAIERHERAAFVQVLGEKTKRVQMEHRLEVIMSTSVGRPAEVQADEAASLPTTTITGQLFNSWGNNIAGMPWEKLIQYLTDNHWLIPPGHLHLRPEVLGAGSFGMVLPALYHGATVVVKAPRASADEASSYKSAVRSMLHELRILRHVHHPNIAPFYGATIDPTSKELMLVMGYICGVDLQTFTGVPPSCQDTADRCKLAQDVCCALRYLHAQAPCIVHGDIKGSNVLVEDTGAGPSAKLLDFGLSCLLTKHARPLGGTPNYMAPEVVQKLRPTCAADVFSFGRLLYMVMTGLCPPHGVRTHRIRGSAEVGYVHPVDWPEAIPLVQECRMLYEACTQLEPDLRPSIMEVHMALHEWPVLPGVKAAGLASVCAQPAAGAEPVLEHARQLLDGRKRKPASCVREGLALLQADVPRRTVAAPSSRRAGSKAGNLQGDWGGPPTTEGARQCPPYIPQQGPVAGAVALAHFAPTPEYSKALSIASILCRWNVETQAAVTCCTFHAAVRDLLRIAATFEARKCTSLLPYADWQCPECKLLDLLDSPGAAVDSISRKIMCAICGYEDTRTCRPPIPALRDPAVEPCDAN